MSELALVDQPPRVRGTSRRPLLVPMAARALDGPRGPFGPIELPSLIYALFRGAFTGTLHLRRGRLAARIPFRKGRPCAVDGPDSDVGVRLFVAGRLNDDEYVRVTEIASQARIGQGDAAVRMGRLDHDALRQFLRHDVHVSLLRFAREPGEYGVVFDPQAVEGASVHEVSPFALVFACVSLTSPAALVHHFDAAGNRHLRSIGNARKYASAIDTYPHARAVLDEVRGTRTVGQVLANSPVGLVETLRVLRALEYLDCVALGDVLGDGAPLDDDAALPRRLGAASAAPAKVSKPPTDAPQAPSRRRRTSGPLPKINEVDIADLVRRTHHRLGKMSFYELLDVDPQALEDESSWPIAPG